MKQYNGQITYKIAYGTKWMNIFYHCSSSNLYFNNQNCLNNSNPMTYSILYALDDSLKINGSFEFLLEYPELTGYNRWTQTENPCTTMEGDFQYPVNNGYKAVQISFYGNYWGGLMRSNYGQTFIDGTSNHHHWWYSIGSYYPFLGGIPGPNDIVVTQVSLWLRINDDTIEPTCSNSISLFILGVYTFISFLPFILLH